MTHYNEDRKFTDYVHTNLAIPIIYERLSLVQQETETEHLRKIDMENGIDYIMLDDSGNEVWCQERFRDDLYKDYSDCTLRYRRDFNPVLSRRESEFFKVEADLLVYGITNGAKFEDKRHTLTNFVKYAVVDLKVLFRNYDDGKIKIGNRRTSYIEGGVLYAGLNQNSDGSSSFVVFDVSQLNTLFGSEGIIVLQKGFY